MNNYYPFVNEPLPYAYDAMEPYIDQKTMELHHDQHLQTYINNLNNLLKDYPLLQQYSLEQLLYYQYMLPVKVRTDILRNAGGVYNHRLYFEELRNPAVKQPVGKLELKVQQTFGDYETFQKQFKEAALSVFGSGYAWLVWNGNALSIMSTANQETPVDVGLYPIFTIDVWEHAYYLKHYNLRTDYIDDWFQVNCWQQAENRFLVI